jgi:predicted RNase H-like HicB family nuclease
VSLVLPEYLLSIKIEKLEEGVYLATSDNLEGLVAQGRTIVETMEIAQDVARKLIESYIHNIIWSLLTIADIME